MELLGSSLYTRWVSHKLVVDNKIIIDNRYQSQWFYTQLVMNWITPLMVLCPLSEWCRQVLLPPIPVTMGLDWWEKWTAPVWTIECGVASHQHVEVHLPLLSLLYVFFFFFSVCSHWLWSTTTSTTKWNSLLRWYSVRECGHIYLQYGLCVGGKQYTGLSGNKPVDRHFAGLCLWLCWWWVLLYC